MLAWSPDDTMLLSCGKEDNQEAFVYSTQVSKHILYGSLHGNRYLALTEVLPPLWLSLFPRPHPQKG